MYDASLEVSMVFHFVPVVDISIFVSRIVMVSLTQSFRQVVGGYDGWQWEEHANQRPTCEERC